MQCLQLCQRDGCMSTCLARVAHKGQAVVVTAVLHAGNGVHAVPSLAVGSAALTSPFLLQHPCAAVIDIDLVSGRIILKAPGGIPNFAAIACRTSLMPLTPAHPQLPLPSAAAANILAISPRRSSSNALVNGHHGGLGELAFSHKVHGPGYSSHPALVDCSLHIGASMAAEQSSGQPNVPVGLGAFMVTATPAAATLSMWAVASLEGSSGDATDVASSSSSSYQLQEVGEHRAGVLLQGLVSKPMRVLPASQATVGGVAANHGVTMADALYGVTWQVSHADAMSTVPSAHASLKRASASAGPAWVIAGQVGRPAVHHSTVAAPISHSCGQGLAILQQAISQQQPSGSRLHLITQTAPSDEGVRGHLVGEAAAAGAMAAAAAGGLLRVAASENATMRFAALDMSSLAMRAAQGGKSGLDADQDAFGACANGGALQLPRLTQAGAGGQSRPQMTANASFTITGGLGGQFPRSCTTTTIPPYHGLQPLSERWYHVQLRWPVCILYGKAFNCLLQNVSSSSGLPVSKVNGSENREWTILPAHSSELVASVCKHFLDRMTWQLAFGNPRAPTLSKQG